MKITRKPTLLPMPIEYRPLKNQTEEEKSAEFFDHLSNSKKPLIYFGGGVISANASEELREFVDTSITCINFNGLGCGWYDINSSLHMLGMHGTPYANYAVQESDFLIAIGSRFDDRVAGVPDKFAPKAKVIIILMSMHQKLIKLRMPLGPILVFYLWH